jgi:hypothetical protein
VAALAGEGGVGGGEVELELDLEEARPAGLHWQVFKRIASTAFLRSCGTGLLPLYY